MGADESSTASRVVLSHPADLSRHGRNRLQQDYYKKWLRKTHDAVAVGDEWDEFTDVGCCGSHMDLPLRVEAVGGGSRIGRDTAIEYTEREARGVNPGWSVQGDEPTGEGTVHDRAQPARPRGRGGSGGATLASRSTRARARSLAPTPSSGTNKDARWDDSRTNATMTGSTLTRDEARVRIEAHKEDVPRFVDALASSEDEEHAKSAREATANSYRQIALFSVYVGDDEEAARSFPKATEWYLKHVEAIDESADLGFRGRDDVRALVDLMEVAVLSGDEDARADASERCLATTVEDSTDHEGLLALAQLLAALVGEDAVAERLDDVDGDDADDVDGDDADDGDDAANGLFGDDTDDADDGDDQEFVASAIESIRGIHEADPDLVARGIEGVLQAHPRGASPVRHAPVSLDALALYVLARERSLVTYDDVSTDSELLSEYHPDEQ